MDRFALIYDKRGLGIGQRDLEPLTKTMLGGEWSQATTTAAGQTGIVQVSVAPGAANLAGCSMPGDPGILLGADLRLDARRDLVAALNRAGFSAEHDAGDGLLLGLAYRAWGSDLPAFILGDFAFALWDGAKRELFAARDHLGVRSVYYAETPTRLYVSNWLEALRAAPGVPDTLHDPAICDFLLCGMPLDAAATAFAAIRRLPPAHRLRAGPHRPTKVTRYWRLPLEEPLYLRKRDMVERFRETLGTAVSDRVGSGGVAVSLSGGVDSATVAALAARTLESRGRLHALRAYTVHSANLWPEGREDEFAARAAEYLGIAWECVRPEDFPTFYDRASRVPAAPEPIHSPQHDLFVRQARVMAGHATVGLTGNGADPALLPAMDYWWTQLRRGRWLQAASGALAFIRMQRRLPPLYLRSRWTQTILRRTAETPPFPPWFHARVVTEHGLKERWQAYLAGAVDPATCDPERPEARKGLLSPHWPFVFWTYSPEVTRIPLDIAHPFFDIRVLALLLRLPTIPWCHQKWIVREAMSGILPDELRLRPKTTPRGDTVRAQLLAAGGTRDRFDEWVEPVRETMERYVDTTRIGSMAGNLRALRAGEVNLIGRPLALAWWLSYNVPK